MGNAIVRRFPTFEIDLITEDTSYLLTYDTKKQLTAEDLEEAIISFSTKNSMADDSPVFSLIILSKEKWDKLLNANDLIRIRAYPDVTQPVPDNPYIMVGLLSDIHKEGEYANGTLLYRLTGRAMTKALMDFEVGVIQEVSMVVPSIGWLPDGTAKGLEFSGSSASKIADQLVERFLYQYAQYNFSDGKFLKDYFTHQFTSWVEDEALADPTPYINYQGSLRQFLEDIAAKPFNELFFEFTKDGTCEAYMRPTPFDPDKWNELYSYTFTSDTVVEESFGKSDAEVFSVYVVQAANVPEFNSMDLGVFPKFHPELIKKYGYKRLDAENRYLTGIGTAGDEPVNGGGAGTGAVAEPKEDVFFLDIHTWKSLNDWIEDMDYNDPEVAKAFSAVIKDDLKRKYTKLSDGHIKAIVESLKAGTWKKSTYYEIIGGIPVGSSEYNEWLALNAYMFVNIYTWKELNDWIVDMGYNEVEAAKSFSAVIKDDLKRKYPNFTTSQVDKIVSALKDNKWNKTTYYDIIGGAPIGSSEYNAWIKENVKIGNAKPTTEVPPADTGTPPPTYEQVLEFINANEFQDAEKIRTQRDTIFSELSAAFPTLSEATINGIIDNIAAGTISREVYNELLLTNGDSGLSEEEAAERTVAMDKLERYTERLYNWYCENANFYSGDIRVLGNPLFRLGVKLFYEDYEQDTVWEFYLESVQHEFSFANGYTTILGVTRGLPDRGAKRFANLWGKHQDFKGGYFGEMSLEDMTNEGKKANAIGNGDGTTGVNWGGGAGGDIAMAAMNVGLSMASKPSVYTFGGGRTGSNPFNSSPIKIDCSAFVWWCYKVNGVELKGGATGMTTDTIKTDPRLTIVSSRGSSKEAAMSMLQQGDIVYFDTYKTDGHMGIYTGNGKFVGSQGKTGIAEADMSSGYWWNVFKGHVLRYGGGGGTTSPASNYV